MTRWQVFWAGIESSPKRMKNNCKRLWKCSEGLGEGRGINSQGRNCLHTQLRHLVFAVESAEGWARNQVQGVNGRWISCSKQLVVKPEGKLV